MSYYTVVEKLGEGGMGVVYTARDNNPARLVALKFLPPDLPCDQDARRRFTIEVQSAPAIDRPNFAVVQKSDDLIDFDEDLAGNRLNYVARDFLGGRSVRSVSASQIWEQILSSFHSTDAASRLYVELNHHLFPASEAFSRSGVIGCPLLTERYAKVLSGLDTVLQERRSSYFRTLINQTPGSAQNPGKLFGSVRGRSRTF